MTTTPERAPEPTRYVNNAGGVRWQPTLSDGRGLVHSTEAWEPALVWSWLDGHGPVLYRSRRRAERIAHRQERREWREKNQNTWRRP